MDESQCISSTPDVKADFSELDKAAAIVTVKHLVARGLMQGPPDLLIVPPHLLTEWWEEAARKYLIERQRERGL